MPDSVAHDPAAITPDGIAETTRLIRPHIRHTPVLAADAAEFGLPPGPLLFKMEQMQHSGSFKARGAFANLLLREVPAAGVVAASGGNHGAAVAYAARRLGVAATIFVPGITSAAKLERIRAYGAELVVGGDRYADALAASEAHVAATGALPSTPSTRSRPCWARAPSARRSRRMRRTWTPCWSRWAAAG